MAEYTLTVYADDDATPLFEVGTASDHANPYLHVPTKYREASVDLLNGGAIIGQYNLQITDPQTGSTKAVRWLTSQLGTDEGHSALTRHRAVYRRVSPDSVVIMDGVVGRIALSESFAGYHVDIKDVRERGRKVKVWDRTPMGDGIQTTVLPRGVVSGYGVLPAGDYLIPATEPFTATAHVGATVEPAVTGVSFEIVGGTTSYSENPTVNPRLVVTDGMLATATPEYSDESDITRAIYRNVEVWWRTSAGADWVKIRDTEHMVPGGAGPLISHYPAKVKVEGNTHNVRTVGYVNATSRDAMDLPTDGSTVEVMVVYSGPPTEDYPWRYEGDWGAFTRNIARGDYSPQEPRLRYDEAALLAIDTPVRVEISEPRDDLREVLEELHHQIGAGVGLNTSAEMTPIRHDLPTSVSGLTVLDDDNCRPIPGWEHDPSEAVTAVEVTYQRDRRIPPESDLDGARAGGDTVAAKPVTVRRAAPDSVLSVMGEEVHEVDAWAFRSLGGDDGQPATGALSDEKGFQLAMEAKDRLLDRFVFGGTRSACETTAAPSVGEWILDRRSWRPNLRSGERGGSTLAQVVSVRQMNEAWVAVELSDAAPEDSPLLAPTIGILAVDSANTLTVPIDTLPAGIAVVQYAVNATEPAADSPLWKWGGERSTVGNVEVPLMPPDRTVWVRARARYPGRLASEWAGGGNVATNAAFSIRRLRLTVADDGSADLEWGVTAAVGGLRIEWVVHPSDEPAPAFTGSADVEPSTEPYQWAPGTVGGDETITVGVTPFEGYAAGAVSGGSGEQVKTAADRTSTPGALTASVVFNAANEAIVQANAPSGTSNIYITVGVDADPADPSSSANDATISGDSGSVNTGVVVAEGSVAHVKVRADSGPVVLELAKNVEGGNISAPEISFDASNNVHVSVIGSPPGTTNLYITVGAGTAPADPTSTTYDATISGDSGSVNTGVVVSAGEVAHVKVGAHDGASMTDIASFTRGNDQATGNQIILGTPRWSPLSGGAILEQPIDFGTDTRSVRVQYQYASTPGGALDTTVNYTFDTGTGGGIVTHAVEDELGAIKEWDAAEAAPSITYTPYDGITGGGNAGNAKTITPDAPGDTGSVGGRVDNKTAALTRPAQGSIIEFDDDSGLEAYVTAGGGAGVRFTGTGYVPTSRLISTASGSGLTGGGDLSLDRSLSVVWSDGYSTLDGRYAQLSGAMFTGGVAVANKALQVRGGANPWPTTGTGVEVAYDTDLVAGGAGVIQAYDRDTSVWKPFSLRGYSLGFYTGGTERLLIAASGVANFASTPTVGGTAVSLEGHNHTLENLDSALAGIVSVSGGAITALSGANADDYIRWDGLSWVVGPLSDHTHDDRYYTEGEIDTILTGPAGSVLKGTDTGSAFGALVESDIPTLGASKITAGTFGTGNYSFPNHLGIGTTDIEAWHSSYAVVDWGGAAAMNNNSHAHYLAGAWHNGTSWLYRKNSTPATMYRQHGSNGLHEFFVAPPSGTSGIDTAVSWTTALTINNNGSAAFGGAVDISGALTLSTALPVASGGTGLGATYAAGDIIYALGASDLTTLGVGTSPDGHVLTLIGGTPAWAAPGGTSGFSGTRTWVSGSDEHTVMVTDGVIDSWAVGPAPA